MNSEDKSSPQFPEAHAAKTEKSDSPVVDAHVHQSAEKDLALFAPEPWIDLEEEYFSLEI
jgi:hypothetical protein